MKPKVIFVSINFFSPEFLDGANKVTYNLLKESDLYSASFLSLYSGKLEPIEEKLFSHVPTASLNAQVSSLRKYSRVFSWIKGNSLASMAKADAIKLARHIEECAESYDVIYLTSLSLASCMQYFSQQVLCKVILGAVDSYSMYCERRVENEKKIFKKWLYRRELKLAQNFEKCFYSLSPKTVFVSSVDEDYSRENMPGGSYLNIPLGVDTDYFRPAPENIKIKPNQIIFTGNLSYAPNRDACRFLVFELLPILKIEIPDIKVVLAGANPTAEILSLSDPSILVTGQVADLRPFIWESALFVCPLRFGSGMKNKVLEILSMEKAALFSSVALEGIENIEGLVSIEPDQLKGKLLKEIKSQLLQANIMKESERSFRRAIKEHYSWSLRRNSYFELFSEVTLSLRKTR